MELTPWAEDPAPKRFRRGTHRCAAPRETLERVGRLMPVMGVTRVANVTGLDVVGIPVFMVCRPNSRSLAVSQGKGLDSAAARASGLMESVEAYHAERVTHPLKLATYNELRFTHAVADPQRLPWVSRESYHDDRRLLWIEGHDLLGDERVWLPFELVHTDFTLPFPSGSGCFPLTSNGLASGNHLHEATVHGICEVVERHGSTLWEGLDPPARAATRIDLSSVDDPACGRLLELYEKAGVGVAAWEMTTGIGAPAFICHIAAREPGPAGLPELFGGMGCHPTRGVALFRALAEAAQSRLTFIAGSRDDLLRGRYGQPPDSDLVAAILSPRDPPPLSFRDVPSWESDTLQEDVAWLLDRLRKAGVGRVLMVDLTRAGFEVPVVKVVIPGLLPKRETASYLPRPLGDRLRALEAEP